ncbi:MAG: tetratricopeptide repeat protein, partial [Myxococcota bacterium]|nr:tetratricopeptide repeat protein [Myxococcota bacterium]
MGGDAPADFARTIDGLKQKLAARPTDRVSQQALVAALLRCKERHPKFFASKKYADDLKKYATTELMTSDLQLTAQNLLADGKREEAQAALMQYISTEQDNPEILYLLARITLQNKDEESAIGYYKATLATDGKHQAALYDLGNIYLKRQELGPARGYLESLLEVNSSHSGAKLAMAQITLYEKGYDQAKALIDQALSAAKNTQNVDEQFRAFWLKAMLSDAQQNLEEKGYALSRALELRSDDERTALELASLLAQQGKHQEALLRLQQCQKAGGGSARFYEALVKSYVATNDPDSAKSQLNEALRKHPKETGLLMLQADGERMAEHFKTAKSIYATIIE